MEEKYSKTCVSKPRHGAGDMIWNTLRDKVAVLLETSKVFYSQEKKRPRQKNLCFVNEIFQPSPFLAQLLSITGGYVEIRLKS